MIAFSSRAEKIMPLVVTGVVLATPLQVLSGPKLQWSQMQWEMVAGVAR